MTSKAQQLAEQLDQFNETLIQFIQSVPETHWRQPCKGEQWSIGVVARHIGVGHYSSMGLAKMIIAGTPLPELSEEQLTQMANDHAAKHADCTREEVLSILATKGREIVDYVAGLSDSDLAAGTDMAVFGGKVTARQLLKTIILKSGGEHLESMRAALAQS